MNTNNPTMNGTKDLNTYFIKKRDMDVKKITGY